MLRQRSQLAWLVVLILAAVIVGMVLLAHREQRMRSLHARAFSSGTTKGIEAVEQLARFSSERAHHLLFNIATSTQPPPDVRIAALRALARSEWVGGGGRLAELLTPNTPLEMRFVLSTLLFGGSCDLACVKHVLLYLEGLWRGERNFENQFPRPASEVHRQLIEQKQEATIKGLLALLRREAETTQMVLVQDYGLGSSRVSGFVPHIALLLRMPRLCDLLVLSFKETQEPIVRRQLESAIQGLSCT